MHLYLLTSVKIVLDQKDLLDILEILVVDSDKNKCSFVPYKVQCKQFCLLDCSAYSLTLPLPSLPASYGGHWPLTSMLCSPSNYEVHVNTPV